MMRLSGTATSRPCSINRWLLDAVDLDLNGAVADRHRVGERSAVSYAEFLDRPQCGTGCAADVVGAVLRLSSSSITVSGMTRPTSTETGEAVGVGDQHRRVDHDPGDRLCRRRRGVRRDAAGVSAGVSAGSSLRSTSALVIVRLRSDVERSVTFTPGRWWNSNYNGASCTRPCRKGGGWSRLGRRESPGRSGIGSAP